MRRCVLLCFSLIWIVVACSSRNITQDSPSANNVQTPLSQHTLQNSSQNLEISQQFSNSTAQFTSETPTPQVIVGAIGPYAFPENVNPLTGLVVEDAAVLNRRPIVVKISNAPPLVRPQSGIGEADIVYEHYTEGGLTRFSAVFLTNAPTRVGSIRSARIIDYEIVSMYGGLLAFSGASIGVEKVIYGWEDVEARIPGSAELAPHVPLPPSPFADRAYKGVLYGLPYYWRDESIPVPHNMFTNVEALWQLADQNGQSQRPDLNGMAFHPDPPPNATGSGLLADIRYRATRVLWHYDPETGQYYRTSDGQRHFDANTETQISAANVVIIYADHFETDIPESQLGDSVTYGLEMTIQGQGDAILYRDGQRYEALWVRDGLFDRLSLRSQDGELLYFKPGTTWFQVVRLPEQMNPQEEWVRVE